LLSTKNLFLFVYLNHAEGKYFIKIWWLEQEVPPLEIRSFKRSLMVVRPVGGRLGNKSSARHIFIFEERFGPRPPTPNNDEHTHRT